MRQNCCQSYLKGVRITARCTWQGGADWLALFANSNSGNAPSLPWAHVPVRYLNRLADECYCEAGFEPNIPKPLFGRLGGFVAQAHGIRAPIAFFTFEGKPSVIELAPSRRVTQIDFAKLRHDN